jgi:hypothetical protein
VHVIGCLVELRGEPVADPIFGLERSKTIDRVKERLVQRCELLVLAPSAAGLSGGRSRGPAA